jgi:hypothetical protein
MHLELMGLPKDPVPPAGSVWHELYPTFCNQYTQGEYQDNGDGEISICDALMLLDSEGDASGWHIRWVGPTYYIVNVMNPQDIGWMEPSELQSGGNPTCEVWTEVYPNHGNQWHINDWQDNGNGILDECDIVQIGSFNDWYHIETISLNIIVEGVPISSEKKTWGEVKSNF